MSNAGIFIPSVARDLNGSQQLQVVAECLDGDSTLGGLGKSERLAGPNQWVATDRPMIWITRPPTTTENRALNEYAVTFVTGEVVEIEAWTPELASAIAEEESEMDGRTLVVQSVRLLASQRSES